MTIREQIIEAIRACATTEVQIAARLGYTQRRVSLILECMSHDGELISEFEPFDRDPYDGVYRYALP